MIIIFRQTIILSHIWPLWHLSSLSQQTVESNRSRWCWSAERERHTGRKRALISPLTEGRLSCGWLANLWLLSVPPYKPHNDSACYAVMQDALIDPLPEPHAPTRREREIERRVETQIRERWTRWIPLEEGAVTGLVGDDAQIGQWRKITQIGNGSKYIKDPGMMHVVWSSRKMRE